MMLKQLKQICDFSANTSVNGDIHNIYTVVDFT